MRSVAVRRAVGSAIMLVAVLAVTLFAVPLAVAAARLYEDDPDIGDQLAAALAGQGHRVRWARTGRAALDHAGRTDRVDLVLLDLGLLDMDGTALCRRLRAAWTTRSSSCSPPEPTRSTSCSASTRAPTTTWPSRSGC